MCTTPFGRPVVPEVYCTYSGVRASTGWAAAGFGGGGEREELVGAEACPVRETVLETRPGHTQHGVDVRGHERVLGRGKFGIDQDGHGPEPGDAEEGRDPRDPVGQCQQHPVPGPHPELREHPGRPRPQLVHLTVGPHLVSLMKRGPPTPPAPLGERGKLRGEIPGPDAHPLLMGVGGGL